MINVEVSMNKKNRFYMRTAILIVMVLAIGYAVFSAVTKDKETVELGQKAPDFKLVDLEGNDVRLSDYKGKGVFLNFWGTYCEPCKAEMPAMNRQYEKYKSQGVEILAVNVDEQDVVVEKFVKQYQLTFPVVIDKGGEVMQAYNISPIPTTFLIDKDGIIVGKITASLDDEKIEAQLEKIKP